MALPTAPAFGEGSVDVNTGPDANSRHGLVMANTGNFGGPGSDPYTVLYVYAQAGETIDLGSSAMGFAGTNIHVYDPGTTLEGRTYPTDPAFTNDRFDCRTNAPGTGVIANGAAGRAQEIAGPLPNPGGYTPCTFPVTTTGIYPVIITSPDPGGSTGPGTVGVPDQAASSWAVAIWDITVRNASGAQSGRVFSNQFAFWETAPPVASGGVQVFPYTRTGYEFQVDMFQHNGAGWSLRADDQGIINNTTGDRLFSSFDCREFVTDPVNDCTDTRAGFGALDGRYPLFVNRPDPIVISGPGGLAETRGYATSPITPTSNPLGSTFTGSAGQAGETNRFSGGTIAVTSPAQLAGLGGTLEIDFNRNSSWNDSVDYSDVQDLETDGTTAYAWSGSDGAGNVPACGVYPYRVRSTLAEVHFPMYDVESSGGTQITRLSLPDDPGLPEELAASYNDVDRIKGRNVTNANPIAADDELSSPTFHAWGDESQTVPPGGPGGGDTDYIDTWVQLPEVDTNGTLEVLCPDVEIVKSSTAPLVAGERGTYRVTMINHGPGTAINATSSDDLPSGVTFVSASDGCSQANGIVTCTEPSLAEGASKTFTITVDVDSSANGCEDVRNTATVTNDTGPDPEPINNSSTICNFEKRADLALTKTASSGTVPTGGQAMYTLVVKNNGPSDDTNVRVKDPIPAGLTLVSADAAQGSCSIAGGDLSCNLGSLKSGGSTQILVTATLTATGCVTNTARVSGDAFDRNLANNVDDARVCPEVGPPPRFDLVVSKTVNKKRPRVGQTVRYRVRVTNRGPDAAPSAIVKDTLNAPVRVVSVRSSQGSCTKRIPMTCELGTIPAGGRVTITIRAKHREPVAGSCSRRGQRNAASATGDGTDTNPANNLDVVRVCPKVQLRLTKKVSTGTVRAGQTFSYTIRVSNPSRVAVRRVRTCDRLPAGLVYVSSKPKARLSKGRHCWTAKRIGARKSKTYKVTVRALAGANGRLVNTARASSPATRTRRVRTPVQVLGQQVDPPQPTG